MSNKKFNFTIEFAINKLLYDQHLIIGNRCLIIFLLQTLWYQSTYLECLLHMKKCLTKDKFLIAVKRVVRPSQTYTTYITSAE